MRTIREYRKKSDAEVNEDRKSATSFIKDLATSNRVKARNAELKAKLNSDSEIVIGHLNLGLFEELLLLCGFPNVGIVEEIAEGFSPLEPVPLSYNEMWLKLEKPLNVESKNKKRKLARLVNFRQDKPGFDPKLLKVIEDTMKDDSKQKKCSEFMTEDQLKKSGVTALSCAFPVVQRKFKRKSSSC